MGMFDSVVSEEREKAIKQKQLEQEKSKRQEEHQRKEDKIKESLFPYIESALDEYPSAVGKIRQARKARMSKKALFGGEKFFWGAGWSLLGASSEAAYKSLFLVDKDGKAYVYDYAVGSRPYEGYDTDYHYYRQISKQEAIEKVADNLISLMKGGPVWTDRYTDPPRSYTLSNGLSDVYDEMISGRYKNAVYKLFEFSLRISNKNR